MLSVSYHDAKYETYSSEKLECFTILVNSPIILNILKFVFVIIPPVRPYGIFNNHTDAYNFINDYTIL